MLKLVPQHQDDYTCQSCGAKATLQLRISRHVSHIYCTDLCQSCVRTLVYEATVSLGPPR
jgi:ribosomal protein L37AE/L43A